MENGYEEGCTREGKVPSQKVGRHWRFRKKAIDRWLDETRVEEPDTKGEQ